MNDMPSLSACIFFLPGPWGSLLALVPDVTSILGIRIITYPVRSYSVELPISIFLVSSTFPLTLSLSWF
jgi:hypothetical protein